MSKKGSQSIRTRRAQHRARQQRQRRLYYGLAAVGALVIVGLFASIRQLNAPTIEEVIMPESVEPPANADGKAWGPLDAPVTIVEYGDFQ
jgi:hypothetical protein